MAMKNLNDALVDEMKDLLSAEQQISKALPKMIKHANSPQLRTGLEEHLQETKDQMERLEKAFKMLEVTARAKKCEGIAGIIAEGEELLKKEAEPSVQDAILIAAAQKVEHYEIASYGSVCAWAKQLGLDDVASLLAESLDEEKRTDQKLTKLASRVNVQASPA
jgi:ferritin-like metal-binding protein YciE